MGLLYAFLADLTLAFHFLFIVFVVGGGVLAWRWSRLVPWHLACAAWGAFVALTNRVCPLTPLESHWLRLAGRAGYEGGFLDRYVAPIVYPSGLTPQIQVGLGVFVIVFNLAVYLVPRLRRRA